jgi:hypothetical protein
VFGEFCIDELSDDLWLFALDWPQCARALSMRIEILG